MSREDERPHPNLITQIGGIRAPCYFGSRGCHRSRSVLSGAANLGNGLARALGRRARSSVAVGVNAMLRLRDPKERTMATLAALPFPQTPARPILAARRRQEMSRLGTRR